MAYSRRQFAKLLQAATACALAGFRPGILQAAKPKGGPFAPLTGSEFRLSSAVPAGPQSLVLRAVETLTRPGRKAPLARHSTPDVEYTTLRFSGEGAELAAGTYRLEHPSAGIFELHLLPGLPGRYRAEFSRLPEGYLASIFIPRAPEPSQPS